MYVKCTVEGLEALSRNCQDLDQKIKSVLGTAVKAGADVIRDDAKSRVHSISGDIAKGIISTITWDKNKSKAFAGVGMDKAMNDKFLVTTKSGTRYYIPTAVEYGHRSPGGAMNIAMTKKGYHKKSKKGTRAHPFMRPAYKSKKSEVAQIIERYILAVIEEGD